MSLQFPPLKALRAFECAARTGSYVDAADELNVTPAAISQQVRKLEGYYDRQLFTRYNNRIVLTDAGTKIYASLGPPLLDLAQRNAHLIDGPTGANLVISVVPSLAQAWLAPQLARYSRLNPLVGLHTRAEEDPVDFTRDKIDLRITYGDQLYSDFDSSRLFQDSVLPMCSPEFAALQSLGQTELQALPDHLFIHTLWGVNYASHPSWSEWFRHKDIERAPSIARGQQVSMSSVALDYACHGLGVLLGQRRLAQNYLQQGRLVVLSETALPLGQAYYAVYPHAGQRRDQVQALLPHLGD
jgi:LysR family transcriptional regulator, glycine cleavage system transcriptional activator